MSFNLRALTIFLPQIKLYVKLIGKQTKAWILLIIYRLLDLHAGKIEWPLFICKRCHYRNLNAQ